jgi:muconolactone delta-isomerase
MPAQKPHGLTIVHNQRRRKMKFLTITKMKDTASTVPPSVMRPLMQATLDLMNQEMKAGRILEAYFMAGSGRSMVISEAKSGEEIVQIISALPIGGFMDFETYPLASFIESMKIYLESYKAAEKMFPTPPK